jgi:hypothetical protein
MGTDPANLKVESAEAITWTDGSLVCPAGRTDEPAGEGTDVNKKKAAPGCRGGLPMDPTGPKA